MFETLTVEAGGPVGRLTLRRPERLNALNLRCLGELVDAARMLDRDQAVKVVVVAGEGRAFCAGVDLDDFASRVALDDASSGGDRRPAREAADQGRRMAEAVTGMRAVTIARIQGHCVGGGLVLAAACDLRVAAEDAVFSIPEVDLGIPLAWGGVPRLVRELGPALTKELVMTCRPFDAAEAAALRFVNRVVPAGRLDAEVDGLAEALAVKSTLTLTVTKQAVNAAAEEAVSTRGAGLDADVVVSAFHDPESREVGARYLASRARER
ncbi:MAG: enoyl-CoA hydratase/isomerase family protein [Acidimicrobiia bacterium]|nr:enoyl-CoA hydratase/isomerase family protein [Acidimicrobiia bacterium]